MIITRTRTLFGGKRTQTVLENNCQQRARVSTPESDYVHLRQCMVWLSRTDGTRALSTNISKHDDCRRINRF